MNQLSSITTIKSVPQGRLGLWILIAGELVIFGGLIASYLLYRFRFPEWSNQAEHTSTLLGGINTFVLLTSSFFVVLAHSSINKNQRKQAIYYLSLTIICGIVFLIIKAIEYSSEISHGFTLSSPALQNSDEKIGSLFWSFYYLMTGLHGVHVLAGMVAMAIVLLGIKKGHNLHRVELVGLYWHMVDLIWIFLFPLLYIAK